MRHLKISGLISGLIFAALLPNSAAAFEIKVLEPIVVANIDMATQRMHVFVNGEQQHTFKVSTGTSRYRTPTGNYRPYRMHRQWYSRKYHGASMPYAIFFTGGYAIHGTGAIGRLGRPASHGCVRMHPSNAARLFKLVKKYGRNRTRVALTGSWKWAPKKSYRKKRRVVRRTARRSRSYNPRTRRRYVRNDRYFRLFGDRPNRRQYRSNRYWR